MSGPAGAPAPAPAAAPSSIALPKVELPKLSLPGLGAGEKDALSDGGKKGDDPEKAAKVRRRPYASLR